MRNTITTRHNLDFQCCPWDKDPTCQLFRIGTCEGQWQYASGKCLMIISVINKAPGNGHLDDVFEWFEYAARRDKVPLLVMEFENMRFKKHCIDKRGFHELPGTNNVIKIFK